MIELRWIERAHNLVLQYRWRYYKLISSDQRGGRVEEIGKWSDWQDVPTVKE